MGLTAVVRCACRDRADCPHENGWLASFHATYESYAGLQNLVAVILEEGRAGSRFPLFMKGTPGRTRLVYRVDKVIQLRSGVSEIHRQLSERKVPGLRLVMEAGEFVEPVKFD